MSRKTDAASQNFDRKNNRRKTDSRRRALNPFSLPLDLANSSCVASFEQMEQRVLLSLSPPTVTEILPIRENQTALIANLTISDTAPSDIANVTDFKLTSDPVGGTLMNTSGTITYNTSGAPNTSNQISVSTPGTGTANVIFIPNTNTFSPTTTFSISVASENTTQPAVSSTTTQNLTVTPPYTPTVDPGSTILAINTVSTNVTLTVGDPSDNNYVHYFQIVPTNDDGQAMLSANSTTITKTNGAYYVPVDASGTQTLTISPTAGMTPDFKFQVYATTTKPASATSPSFATGEVNVVAPPVFTVVTPASQFKGNGSVVVVPSNSTLTAADNIASATITFTPTDFTNGTRDETFDISQFNNSSDVNVSQTYNLANSGNVVVTLAAKSGSISPDAMLKDLKLVGYNDSSPTGMSRTFTIVVKDTATNPQMSTPATATVDFIDQKPVISNPTIPNFLENVTQTFAGNTALTITDSFSPNALENVTVHVSNGKLLQFGTNTLLRTLTFTGKTAAQVTSALANLQYTADAGLSQDPSNNNSQQSDTLTIVATQVSGYNGSGGPTSNTQSITLPVQPVANLSVVVAPSTTNVQAGTSVTYLVTIKNNSPDAADSVSIQNAFALAGLTNNLSFSSPKLNSSTNSSQAITSTTNPPVGTVGFQFNNPVKAGETDVVSITVTPTAKGTLTETSTVAFTELPSGSTVNSTSVNVADDGKIFISPSPTDTHAFPTAGSTSTFTINVDRSALGSSDSSSGFTSAASVLVTLGSLQYYGMSAGDFSFSFNDQLITPTPTNPADQTAPGTFTLTFPASANASDSNLALVVTLYGTDSIIASTFASSFTLTLSSPQNAALDPARSSLTETLQNTNSLIVTSNQDDGVGSLRRVLATAKSFQTSSGFPVSITFNIPSSNSHIIQLQSPLQISSQVFIDGSSQQSAVANPIQIEPENSYIGDGVEFTSGSSGSILQSIGVSGFSGSAIDLMTDGISILKSTISGVTSGLSISSTNNTISGNSISGSSGTGISLLNTSDVNTISGNWIHGSDNGFVDGIALTGATNTSISNNTIGGTFGVGINLSGGTDTGTRITGNSINGKGTDGIDLVGVGNSTISGNTINGPSGKGISLSNASGIDISGNTIIGTASGFDGIALDASLNTMISNNSIGGTLALGVILNNATGSNLFRNSITGATDGVSVSGGSGTSIGSNTITNSVNNGIDLSGTESTLDVEQKYFVDLEFNIIRGTYHPATSITAGNQSDGIYLHDLKASPSTHLITIHGNQVNSVLGNGIEVVGVPNVQILGNFVGITPSGLEDSALSNQGNGISVSSSGFVVIANNNVAQSYNGLYLDGDLSASVSGNTLVSNLQNGLLAIVTDSLHLYANAIGTNSKNASNLGNTLSGASITQSSNVVIQFNSLSGNSTIGLTLNASPGATISSNDIGVGFNGATPIGNKGGGIDLIGSTGILVQNNTISANGTGTFGYGLNVTNSNELTIQNNFIGTDSNGTSPLGNRGDGVDIDFSLSVFVMHNIISANLRNGIYVTGGNAPQITFNQFGTGSTNTESLGNGTPGQADGSSSGLLLSNTSHANVSSNTFANNYYSGLEIFGGSSNYVASNNLSGNVGVGVLIENSSGDLLSSNTMSDNVNSGVFINAASEEKNVNVSLDQNVIETNGSQGVFISGPSSRIFLTGNKVDSNVLAGILISATQSDSSSPSVMFIGTNDVSSNGTYGVRLAGAMGVQVNQVTSTMNGLSGVQIDSMSSNNTVSNSIIESNFVNGVDIEEDASSNTISGNTIGLNQGSGILLTGISTGHNLIQFNTIGGVGLANVNDGVSILGITGIPGITTLPNTLDSNTIIKNNNNGVTISNTTVVQSLTNNYIGTNSAQAKTLGNLNYGIFISGSNNTSIASGNHISFNQSNGVVISSGMGNSLEGSTISSNGLAGVLLLTTSGNQIGPAGQVGSPNTIVSNATDGVQVFTGSSGNTISGNFIGTDINNDVYTDKSNTTTYSNLGDGVHIVGSRSNTVGGNVISANKQSGVEIFGSSNSNTVIGNVLGTLLNNSLLGNKLNGVLISGSVATPASDSTKASDSTDPMNNLIQGNYLSGNQANGVAINLANSNNVMGNFFGAYAMIGTPQDGMANSLNGISNTLDGISVDLSAFTVIQGNVIAKDGVDGISLNNSSATTINGNTILHNAADGIRVANNSSNTGIGVANPGQVSTGNTILGNAGAGVEISTGSSGIYLQHNLIGISTPSVFNSAGVLVTPGSIDGNGDGVLLNQVQNNIIGGGSLADANTITGNLVAGVFIAGNAPILTVQSYVPGNVVQNNFIGTDPNGQSPGVFPTLNGVYGDIGVYALNSSSNYIAGNVVSGNHAAGIDLFGALSTNNTVQANIVGSNASKTAAIVFSIPTNNPLYSASLPTDSSSVLQPRQAYGIEVNAASSNMILSNIVLGNQIGIDVRGGSGATSNTIAGNKVGVLGYIPGMSALSSLENFDGIYIDNTPGNLILGNDLEGNVSIGIGLVGPAATGNIISANTTSGTGGYADPQLFKSGLVSLIDYNSAKADATGANPVNVPLFGSGIYIDQASLNRIGVGSKSSGNTISDNLLAGIYVLNDGTSLYNYIQNNTISGLDQGTTIDEYGILLVNSSGNLPNNGSFTLPTGSPPSGVILTPPNANVFATNTYQFAAFREYTGAFDPTTAIFTPPKKVSASNTVKIKATSATQAVKVTTGGTGHPVPPVMKTSSARKR